MSHERAFRGLGFVGHTTEKGRLVLCLEGLVDREHRTERLKGLLVESHPHRDRELGLGDIRREILRDDRREKLGIHVATAEDSLHLEDFCKVCFVRKVCIKGYHMF